MNQFHITLTLNVWSWVVFVRAKIIF